MEANNSATAESQPSYIDIQNSIKAQNSQTMSVGQRFLVNKAAQTLIFAENIYLEMEKLQQKAQQAKDDFNNLNSHIQTIDARLKDISAL